jgi:hypothetical protein
MNLRKKDFQGIYATLCSKRWQMRRFLFSPQEVELHKTDLEIFKKWLASGLEIDEFLRTSGTKYRGRITGKKFGI